MGFKCRDCDREVSNAEMIGIATAQIGREAAASKGITPQQKGDFLAGILNGLRISCPNCHESNWKFQF